MRVWHVGALGFVFAVCSVLGFGGGVGGKLALAILVLIPV